MQMTARVCRQEFVGPLQPLRLEALALTADVAVAAVELYSNLGPRAPIGQ